ncbi:MAG: hypothetical protein ACRD9S_18745 [Pyrinomonadaceae bacterium]
MTVLRTTDARIRPLSRANDKFQMAIFRRVRDEIRDWLKAFSKVY